MNNPMFVDEKNIPMVNQDEDCEADYRTQDTSLLDVSFIIHMV